MNLEKQLIAGLLVKDEIAIEDRVKLLNAVNYPFSNHSQTVLDFIFSHQTSYKNIPQLETVKEKFPNFELEYGNEPYIFYLEKAVEFKKTRHIQKSLLNIEKLIADGKINQALMEYSLAARDFESMDVRSHDIDFRQEVGSYVTGYKETRENGTPHGIFTGLTMIDNSTFGAMPGDFWVLAGRPGSYKTFIMCFIYAFIGKMNEGNILFFSKEMTKQQIQARVSAIIAGVSFKALRRYQLNDYQLHMLEENTKLLKGNLIIIGRDTRSDYDIPFVRSKIIEYSPIISFVDGLYLFSKGTEWGDQTNATRSIREIALSTNSPIIGTTQFNRSKGKKDQDNIAYSDSFLQDASVLIGMERVYDEVKEKMTSTVKITTLKVRDDEDQMSMVVRPNFDNCTLEETAMPQNDSDDDLISGVLNDD